MISKTDKVIESSEFLKGSNAVKTWIRIGDFSDATGQGYTQGLKQYCAFHKMSPEELIEEAEEQHSLLPRQQNIILRLADFKKSISSKSPNTQKMHLAGVRSFYKNLSNCLHLLGYLELSLLPQTLANQYIESYTNTYEIHSNDTTSRPSFHSIRLCDRI